MINTEAVALPHVFDARDETGDIADADVLTTIGRLAGEVLVATGLQLSSDHLDGTISTYTRASTDPHTNQTIDAG